MELYILNEKLERIEIVDDYTSLIWARRYNDIGDCEIYIEATPKYISLFKRGYYIERSDDDMICRIKKIQLETDIENGDYLIISGYDVKDILNQRIIWNELIFNGTVENYILRIIRDAFNMDALETTHRQIKNFKIVDRERNLNDGINEKVIYDNVGEKVQALCKKHEYGYRVYRNGGNLLFDLYKGDDRSNQVIFSPTYDNLLSTNYTEDATNIKNVALVGGIGEGKEQIRNISSYVHGIDRYEMYIDASSLSNTTTYIELKTIYPLKEVGGVAYIHPKTATEIKYMVDYLDVILIDNIQFNDLKEIYTSGSICYAKSNGQYEYIAKDGRTLDQLKLDYPEEIILYQIYGVELANLPTAKIDETDPNKIIPPQDNDNVTIANLLYNNYLLNKGYEEIAKNGLKTSFDGNIEASVTFKYNEDYYLGDLVLVENEYGIRSKARIIETIETFDENGYSLEPKFEFKEVK